jgi:hypothetical protein
VAGRGVGAIRRGGAAGGEGALLRPAVPGGARRLAGDPGRERLAGRPGRALLGGSLQREPRRARARALAEYGRYLAARPTDRTLAEEAKTSRIALAVKLAKAGQPAHAAIARDALTDSNRTVRYFAALQLASLGPERGKPAVPVLQEILAKEKDEDLVERAKLALLRVDRNALPAAAPAPAPKPGGREAAWVRIRIYEKGDSKPNVAINLPVALADLVFKALPDEAIADLRKEGYDARSFWQALKKTGPAEILTIEGKDGERIQVWLE